MTGRRGFTLLEVMVASLIMGIAVAGVLSGLAGAARNASRLTDYDRATLVAKQKMDELLLDRDRAAESADRRNPRCLDHGQYKNGLACAHLSV